MTILDTASGKPVKDLKFDGPVKIGLCRGERLFLIDLSNGNLLVISRKDGWKTAATLPSGSANVVVLLAPGGEFFKNQILAVAPEKSTDRASRPGRTYLVDLNGAKPVLIRFDAMQAITYDGRYGYLEGYDDPRPCEWCLAGAVPEERRKPNGSKGGSPRQYRPGIFWESLQTGLRHAPVLGYNPVVLDRTTPMAYGCTARDNRCAAYDLDRDLSKDPLPIPCAMRPSLAATLDGVTYFYGAPAGNTLFRQTWTHAQRPADSQPDMPAQVTVGRKITFKLPGADKATELAVAKGPKGIDVSKDGSVSWTPADEDAGEQTIRFRLSKPDGPDFVRWNVQVLPADPHDRNPTHDLRYAVLCDEYRLVPSLDRQRLLYLQDGLLVILDADSLCELRRVFLGDYYRFIADRGEYYLVLTDTRADLLDKQDFKVLRSIDLLTRRVSDFAPSPTQQVTYITATMHGRIDPSVLTIDETHGVAIFGPPAQAEHVLVGPMGKDLFICNGVVQLPGKPPAPECCTVWISRRRRRS